MKTSCVVEQTTQRGEPGGGGAASSSLSSSSSKSTVRVGSGALKGACTGSFAGTSTAAARLSGASSSLDESPPVGGSAGRGCAADAELLAGALPPGRRRAGRSTGRKVCEELRFCPLRRGIRVRFLRRAPP